MDLQDMENLILVYDAMRKVEDAVEIICGERCADGALGELSCVSDIMQKYSTCIDEELDPDHKKFWGILEDDRFEPSERAKQLMSKQ